MGGVLSPLLLQKGFVLKVAIIGMGRSRDEYIKDRLLNGVEYDEIWGINAIGDLYKCDKIFMLDDVRYLVGKQPARYNFLKDTTTEVITKTKYPEFSDSLVEYPYEEICQKFQTRYFSNTVAYAIAYALYTDVKEMVFFGCDYDYEGQVHEINRAGTEFWLGIAHALGVKVGITDQSSLLNMNTIQSYSYDEKITE